MQMNRYCSLAFQQHWLANYFQEDAKFSLWYGSSKTAARSHLLGDVGLGMGFGTRLYKCQLSCKNIRSVVMKTSVMSNFFS